MAATAAPETLRGPLPPHAHRTASAASGSVLHFPLHGRREAADPRHGHFRRVLDTYTPGSIHGTVRRGATRGWQTVSTVVQP